MTRLVWESPQYSALMNDARYDSPGSSQDYVALMIWDKTLLTGSGCKLTDKEIALAARKD